MFLIIWKILCLDITLERVQCVMLMKLGCQLSIKLQMLLLSVEQSKLLLLLFTRPLPRDRGMAEDHGAPESGQLPRAWTRGRKETESRQRVSGAKSP